MRVHHPWWLWEDYKSGFYENWTGAKREEGCQKYAEFLGSSVRFRAGLIKVLRKWKYSSEHNLTNEGMNRIAYLGQASICVVKGIPSCCRGGFFRLSEDKQHKANLVALEYLNKWLADNGREPTTLERSLKGRVKERFVEVAEAGNKTERNFLSYETTWKQRGYSDGLPDEVPVELSKTNKAPSYKAVATAILSNDLNLHSLGFSPKVSPVYKELKRIEIERRNASLQPG